MSQRRGKLAQKACEQQFQMPHFGGARLLFVQVGLLEVISRPVVELERARQGSEDEIPRPLMERHYLERLVPDELALGQVVFVKQYPLGVAASGEQFGR